MGEANTAEGDRQTMERSGTNLSWNGRRIRFRIALDFVEKLVESRLRRSLPVERGVTPLVGIVTMVAVVTVLGSVVGAMALGLTDETARPSQAAWDAQVHACNGTDDGVVRIRHQGGQGTSGGPLVVHYRWANNSTTEVQRIDVYATGPIESSDVAHERRVDEPELLAQIALTWEEADESYTLREFTPSTTLEIKSSCFGSEVEPGFVVQGDECVGDPDGSGPAEDRGHGDDCDTSDEENPGKGNRGPNA